MKLIDSFNEFLNDVVNLNKTRVDRAMQGIEAVTKFLNKNDIFKNKFIKVTPQGSFRQKTIIRPATDKKEFDVDLLFELKEVNGWEPRDYLQILHNEFKKTDRYRDIVDNRQKVRCVTLDYDSDFHIDIVPCIRRDGSYWIINRETNQLEETDADGYAQWFEHKNSITGNNYLIKVVRLIKYLRDIRNMPIKSVLLTTLLGSEVRDDNQTSVYSDLSTALKVLCSRLDSYLQKHSNIPVVMNPAIPTENFSRHWNLKQYDEFKTKIHKYTAIINEAHDSTDVEQSVAKWREVFGDEFPLNEAETGELAKEKVPVFPLGDISHCRPVADICKTERLEYKVKVNGYLYSKDGRVKFRGINSDVRFGSNLAIKYIAYTAVPSPREVYWQVVNTGAHAASDTGLGGNFFKAKRLSGTQSISPLTNWERSLYTGKHWIECFIVKDSVCMARSGKFYVNIKNPRY